ncbi:hypothetical protein VCR15J2_390040 [Vibrio coralliirubri]|uniref:hypothetical protein n=1 Tax=Vibrio coralliirubri TaxID=1516159 RepID=UPI000632A519|nr:hypothetical protein [Vibrio coralliirubri]CDT53057.1 hypothetical protein VCR15J2_390040 [Vibrio coralliirubri]
MDPKNLDKVINKISKMSEKEMSDVASEMARYEGDREAKEFGIERLTILTSSDTEILLIKPNQLFPSWQLNLFGSGSINFDGQPDFECSEIPGSLYRFAVKDGSVTYWADAKDRFQLDKISKFVGVEIVNPIETSS